MISPLCHQPLEICAQHSPFQNQCLKSDIHKHTQKATMLYLQIVVAITSLGVASGQHCESSCGNVSISYPFGSGEGCYHGPEFLVTCNRSSGEPTPFYGPSDDNTIIRSISMSNGEMEIEGFVAHDCYNSSGPTVSNYPTLTLTNFRISTKNRFVAIGCDTYAYILGTRGNESISSGCVTTCNSSNHMTDGYCSGVGCCEITIPEGMSYFELQANSYGNHTGILGFNPCGHAFVVEDGKYHFSSSDLLDFQSKENMPMLLDWAIGNVSCDTANHTGNLLCKGNSVCDQNYTGPGYRCRCLQGFEGNPYIADNCTNINECAHQDHGCLHKCIDQEGSYRCTCRKGYSGDGRIRGSGCIADQSLVVKTAICASTALILVLVLITWVYVGIKKRKVIKLREKFFRQNGGVMLQQRISRDRGSLERVKVLFTTEELKRATNNYDESRIIGKGGFGTVYKGVLSDNNNTPVAIKKSKLTDQTQTQIEQFVNEVIILSQINHKNVVKLFGCCLETEVPLLVYEFIPNGTLSDHIHNKSMSVALTWDIRLRIAAETAGALSYLHSEASVPIIHRDIKPMNILLDDNYVAKVADFGASRLIPTDQIELATIVQGTLGYLDPEYLQTNQLTDKSDVYSFGVVLVELLTGRKALSFDKPENERNLAIYFLSYFKEGRLLQILDEHLQLTQVPDEIIQVSRLAERCLRVKGDERPSMKEVAIELEGILRGMIHKHPWVQTSLNEDEVAHLLNQPIIDNYESTNESIGSSRSTFDSISTHTILPIAGGR